MDVKQQQLLTQDKNLFRVILENQLLLPPTPIDLGQRIDLNSTEVGICKMSIILTWFISLTVIIMSSTVIAVKLGSYSWIGVLIIVIFAIVYFVGLGYLSKAF